MRTLKRITLNRVLSLNLCKTREELLDLSNGRKWLTPVEICDIAVDLPNEGVNPISPGDIFQLFRDLPVLSDSAWRLFACDCAEHVLELFVDRFPEDPEPRQCIESSRLYAVGKITKEEMAAVEKESARMCESQKYRWKHQRCFSGAIQAAKAAIYAADTTLAPAIAALHAALQARIARGCRSGARTGYFPESLWQIKRLREYLRNLEKNS